jgi:uncharacterized membrane protein
MLPLVAALGIGFVAGLRTMTAPAAVALIRHEGLLSPLLVAAALAEIAIDKWPKMPSRLLSPFIFVRLASGAACGLFLVGGIAAAVLGVVGALAGAHAGAWWRASMAKTGKIPDWPIALLEDAVAVALAYLVVSNLSSTNPV